MNIEVILRNIEILLYLINVKATKVLRYHNLNQNLCYNNMGRFLLINTNIKKYSVYFI